MQPKNSPKGEFFNDIELCSMRYHFVMISHLCDDIQTMFGLRII